MVSKDPEGNKNNDGEQAPDQNSLADSQSSDSKHVDNTAVPSDTVENNEANPTSDTALPSNDDAAVLQTGSIDNVATRQAKRPTSLESNSSDSPHRHKHLANNGFDRLEIQKPKLTGKLSDSAIECASRQREKTPLSEKLSDSVIPSSRRTRKHRNSSSGEEKDEISSLIGETSINKSSDSVFDDNIQIERSPRRHRGSRRYSEGPHAHHSSPRNSEFRRSRRSIRASTSNEQHTRKPSVRRMSSTNPHGQRKLSVAPSERKDSSPQQFNAQQLDYLRRKSKKFHGPYMSPGLNIAQSYRNPGAEILMAVLIILVGLVTLIVSYATGTRVWLIVGCVCLSLGGMFLLLGLCWYCATPHGKDPAYSVQIKGITNRGSQRESTRSRVSREDDEERNISLLEKLERRSASASPIPV